MSNASDKGREDARSQVASEERTGLGGAILRGLSLGMGDDYHPPSDPEAKAEYDKAYSETYRNR